MIFVIAGTQKFQFNRLFKKIDELILAKEITERVFAQVGCSTYIPQNYESEKFLSTQEFKDKIGAADIVVTHSGEGSIITSLKTQKKIVVVPRLAEYGEHVDDHQLEIARAFADKNYLELCDSIEHLGQAISNARSKGFAEFAGGKRKIADIIEEFLNG